MSVNLSWASAKQLEFYRELLDVLGGNGFDRVTRDGKRRIVLVKPNEKYL
ncbi:gp104 [Mycobacterium phage Barnyard]|uniref:Uncharacterized protein n=1 Tax=Mycobacterium phage Barnyard TaxID=205880 RepID=Q855W8_9CAUD|nr:gp104 [Mycobacterium phage Barnyard]AAN02158.1 hypothetical protein PBI_BARNYARD_104 [Mycobacterium phage Barnyard]